MSSATEVIAAPVVPVPVAREEPMAVDAGETTTQTKSPCKKTTKTLAAKKAAVPKTPRKSAGNGDAHPKYSQMINDAISNLKDRNGSSRQAILKYILCNYTVQTDARQVNNHLKMSLRAGVKSGKLRQSKGSGACGSYKLGAEQKPRAKAGKKVAKMTKVKKPRMAGINSSSAKVATKKAKSPKKSAKSPAKSAKSPAKTPKAAKSPKAARKATKAVKKPKTPKKTKEAKAAPVQEPQAAAENQAPAVQETTPAPVTTPAPITTSAPAPSQVKKPVGKKGKGANAKGSA